MAYSKVDRRIWHDAKFMALSDDAKLLFLRLLTHPELTCLGAMRATPSSIGWRTPSSTPSSTPSRTASSTPWATAKVRRVMFELKTLAFFSEDEEILVIPHYLKYNPPPSANHVKRAWQAALDRLPEGNGKALVARNCLNFLESCTNAVKDAVPDAVKDALRDAVSNAVLDSESEAVVLREEEEPPFIPHSKNKRRHALPDDFTLTPERLAVARKFNLADPQREFDNFVDYWRGDGGLKADWDATWRNRCRDIGPGGRFANKGEQVMPSQEERIRQGLEAHRRLFPHRYKTQTPKPPPTPEGLPPEPDGPDGDDDTEYSYADECPS